MYIQESWLSVVKELKYFPINKLSGNIVKVIDDLKVIRVNKMSTLNQLVNLKKKYLKALNNPNINSEIEKNIKKKIKETNFAISSVNNYLKAVEDRILAGMAAAKRQDGTVRMFIQNVNKEIQGHWFEHFILKEDKNNLKLKAQTYLKNAEKLRKKKEYIKAIREAMKAKKIVTMAKMNKKKLSTRIKRFVIKAIGILTIILVLNFKYNLFDFFANKLLALSKYLNTKIAQTIKFNKDMISGIINDIISKVKNLFESFKNFINKLHKKFKSNQVKIKKIAKDIKKA